MKRKRHRNPAAAVDRPALQCYVCQTIEQDMPPFVAYPVCSCCLTLTPIQIVKLEPAAQKRAALALVVNTLLPELGSSLAGMLRKKFGGASAGRKRG